MYMYRITEDMYSYVVYACHGAYGASNSDIIDDVT